MIARNWALVSAMISMGCGSDEHTDPETSPYLEAAVMVGKWLHANSIDDTGSNIPDELSTHEFTPGLGSGAAGRALFFAELYSATQDSTFRVLAIASANAATADFRESGEIGNLGLYRGLAGVASATAEVGAVVEDAGLRSTARSLFLRMADADDQSIGKKWGDINDVLVGRAGIGLSFLYAFEAFRDSVLLDAAVSVGDELLGVGEAVPGNGLRWRRGEKSPLDLPNFSHGTAGVGFFLARLAAFSRHERFAAAANKAANYISQIADLRDSLFLVPYGVPNDGYVTPYDIGWAHGPAGTSRFFYALLTNSGSPPLTESINAGARAILASGIPGASRDSTLWTGPFQIDRRFGTAGAAAFLLDWGMLTGNRDFLNGAKKIVDDILDNGLQDDNGLFWRLPLYGFQGDGERVFTGYFYGAAGLGLILIQQHYALSGEFMRTRLPDDPFPRGELGGR